MIKTKIVKEFDHLPIMGQKMAQRAAAVVRVATFNVQSRVKLSMEPPKTGLIYKRPGGKTHLASAPGEAPAIDYGNLVNSIQVDFENGGLTGIVFTSRDYAALLEFGGAHVAARPFMEPAVNAEWPAFLAAMMQVANGN